MGVGAGAVGGPRGALAACEGRDFLGIGVDNADCVVTTVCHIQLCAGDGQAGRKVELGVGAGGVFISIDALHAGEGRDFLGLGVDNADCVVKFICDVQLGAGDGQAVWHTELGDGAGAVGGPIASAGEGCDLLGLGVDNADCVVEFICDVQLGAGDGQAPRKEELGVGAGAVGGPIDALAAGDGRDLLGLRVHNTDCVVTSICHIKLGAGDGQALWIIELGAGAGGVNQPIGIRIAGKVRDHRISCWGARAWSWCGSRGWGRGWSWCG